MRTTKKPKAANEPSTRDKLSAKFDADLLADYEAHGREAIAAAREKSPEKWLDAVGRRISAIEPRPDGYESCQDMREIAIKHLQSIGFSDPDERSIQAAIEANDIFVNTLQQIRAEGEGQLQ